MSGESLKDMSTTAPLNKEFLSYSNYGIINLEIFNLDWNFLFMIDNVS